MYNREYKNYREYRPVQPAVGKTSSEQTVRIMPFTDEEEIEAWDEYARQKAQN